VSIHYSYEYIIVTGRVKLLMQSRLNIPPSQKSRKDWLEDLKIMLYLLREETECVAIVTESCQWSRICTNGAFADRRCQSERIHFLTFRIQNVSWMTFLLYFITVPAINTMKAIQLEPMKFLNNQMICLKSYTYIRTAFLPLETG
jgi:hypothetical protein